MSLDTATGADLDFIGYRMHARKRHPGEADMPYRQHLQRWFNENSTTCGPCPCPDCKPDSLEDTQRLPNIEAERREFEAWASRALVCTIERYRDGAYSGEYVTPRARAAWAAWMARASQ